MLSTLILVLRLFDPTGAQYAEGIATQSAKHKLDPLLVAAVMYHESRYKSDVCYRGSHGLMAIQLRGRSCQKTKAEAERLRLYDPEENIRRGVELLANARSWCRSQGHDHHWLLHYNQGYGACPDDKPVCTARERRVATTGRAGDYARKVLSTFRRLQKIKAKVERGPNA
jgi:hypothetical protein